MRAHTGTGPEEVTIDASGSGADPSPRPPERHGRHAHGRGLPRPWAHPGRVPDSALRRELDALPRDGVPPGGSVLPPWFPRAVWYVISSVFAALGLWYVASRLTDLMVTLAICFFLAFALEPTVTRLHRSRGIRRRRATLLLFVAGAVVLAAATLLLGRLFVDQATGLMTTVPDVYGEVRGRVSSGLGVRLPEGGALVRQLVAERGTALAGSALGLLSSFFGVVFGSLTVLLVTFYLVADGPRFRRAVLSPLPPRRQRELLAIWEVAIDKTSSYIVSRAVLATICGATTAVFLLVVQVPNWLVLGALTGVVAQFVPTIGTYVAGAVPVVYALTSRGPATGIAVLVFVLVYQQVENLTIEPQIGARAMRMNPAVSFLAVLAGAAVLGPLGAVLALPFAATVQAFAGTYVHRHDVVESDLVAGDDEHAAARAREREGVRRVRRVRPRRGHWST